MGFVFCHPVIGEGVLLKVLLLWFNMLFFFHADNLECGEHEFMGETFHVQPLEDTSEKQTDKYSILVIGVPEKIDEKTLQILFSSTSRGGGPVESVKIFQQANQKLAIITFKDCNGMFAYFIQNRSNSL